MSFPWLTTIGVVPLIGALVLMLLPKTSTELAKRLAVVFSVIPLILVIAMALQFDADSTAEFQFVESHSWIRSFGISYQVGVDGISLVLIALSVILVPLVILAAWNDADDSMGSVRATSPCCSSSKHSWSVFLLPPTCSSSTSSSRRCSSRSTS